MSLHFTFLGTITHAINERTALIKIGTYDCFAPMEPELDEVMVYLNNLNAPQTMTDLKHAELEVTIGSMPMSTKDLVYGVYRRINHVEKFITEDYLTASMEKNSRMHLEAFLKNLSACRVLANGNLLFKGKVSARYEGDFVRESLSVEVSFQNNLGQLKLHESWKVGTKRTSAVYNTRSHIMKTTTDGALVILGQSANLKEFAVWLRPE